MSKHKMLNEQNTPKYLSYDACCIMPALCPFIQLDSTGPELQEDFSTTLKNSIHQKGGQIPAVIFPGISLCSLISGCRWSQSHALRGGKLVQ